jgi:hypothetical protein
MGFQSLKTRIDNIRVLHQAVCIGHDTNGYRLLGYRKRHTNHCAYVWIGGAFIDCLEVLNDEAWYSLRQGRPTPGEESSVAGAPTHGFVGEFY